jgi:protein phosphatase 2C family protein 2/3
MKPDNKECAVWPRCSFFGIFDGHGGSSCADFLRDRLHHFVVNESSFPSNPKEAILLGFEKAEAEWTNKYAL